MASLARRENPIYEDVRSDVGLGMFFGLPMNPPDDERAKVNKPHKQIQPVLRNHPIEKVEKLALVEHGVNFHKPISIVVSMQLRRRFRNSNHAMAGRHRRMRASGAGNPALIWSDATAIGEANAMKFGHGVKPSTCRATKAGSLRCLRG